MKLLSAESVRTSDVGVSDMVARTDGGDTRITLAAGDEKTGLDMSLNIVRATRVSGTVAGASGPVQAGSMRLIPEADADAHGINL